MKRVFLRFCFRLCDFIRFFNGNNKLIKYFINIHYYLQINSKDLLNPLFYKKENNNKVGYLLCVGI